MHLQRLKTATAARSTSALVRFIMLEKAFKMNNQTKKKGRGW